MLASGGDVRGQLNFVEMVVSFCSPSSDSVVLPQSISRQSEIAPVRALVPCYQSPRVVGQMVNPSARVDKVGHQSRCVVGDAVGLACGIDDTRQTSSGHLNDCLLTSRRDDRRQSSIGSAADAGYVS